VTRDISFGALACAAATAAVGTESILNNIIYVCVAYATAAATSIAIAIVTTVVIIST